MYKRRSRVLGEEMLKGAARLLNDGACVRVFACLCIFASVYTSVCEKVSTFNEIKFIKLHNSITT